MQDQENQKTLVIPEEIAYIMTATTQTHRDSNSVYIKCKKKKSVEINK